MLIWALRAEASLRGGANSGCTSKWTASMQQFKLFALLCPNARGLRINRASAHTSLFTTVAGIVGTVFSFRLSVGALREESTSNSEIYTIVNFVKQRAVHKISNRHPY
jgi:hypothetical protein